MVLAWLGIGHEPIPVRHLALLELSLYSGTTSGVLRDVTRDLFDDVFPTVSIVKTEQGKGCLNLFLRRRRGGVGGGTQLLMGM